MGFTNPFRYRPHPLVIKAAERLMERIDADPALSSVLSEGKMLGVLICKDGTSLAAFSGTVAGKSLIEGFVPPIYDLTERSGEFKTREAEISAMNRKVALLQKELEESGIDARLQEYEQSKADEIEAFKREMAASRERRKEIRSSTDDPARLEQLEKESQFEKAELKRLKARWGNIICRALDSKAAAEEEIKRLKKRRAEMSDRLQEWIFRQYIVHNALGEEASIAEIFAECGMTPPGGTGECAAPKLLEHAFRHALEPLAMGEFWYGRSPDSAVRTHGHFYPSCTSKCGPLLKWMLKGIGMEAEDTACETPLTVYEDDAVVVAEKPCGMPSVPGLDGRESLQEHLMTAMKTRLYPVHRLDMDTSGLILFAKTESAAVNLMAQFEERKILKTYIARLSPPDSPCITDKIKTGSKGIIDLALSPDHDERPRQKADITQGRPALTEYEITSVNQDGTCDVIFRPVTGRTHQLRVHAAHHLGLGRPILGDLLYGGCSPCHGSDTGSTRLCLHACEIVFQHPANGKKIHIKKMRSLL